MCVFFKKEMKRNMFPVHFLVCKYTEAPKILKIEWIQRM